MINLLFSNKKEINTNWMLFFLVLEEEWGNNRRSWLLQNWFVFTKALSLGELSSRAWTEIGCDVQDYVLFAILVRMIFVILILCKTCKCNTTLTSRLFFLGISFLIEHQTRITNLLFSSKIDSAKNRGKFWYGWSLITYITAFKNIKY